MSEPSTNRRVAIRVEGIVQGVTYRASARRVARELGITADPVNLDDGSVRIVASGSPAALDRFIAWCRHGPPAARVTDMQVRDLD